MRRAAIALAITAGLLAPATAQAATGWAPYRGHYVRWSTTTERPIDAIAGDWLTFLADRDQAIRRAKRANRRWAAIVAAQEALSAAHAGSGTYAPGAPAPAPSGPINWWAIADCESGDADGLPPYTPDWSYNGPSGFDGGLQFLPSTWTNAGGGKYAPYAWGATAEEQIAIASTLPLSSWPSCQRFA